MGAPEKIYVIEQEAAKGTILLASAELNDFAEQNDAKEYARTDAFIEKACRCYCDDICDQRLCGMCFYKHDGQGQIKNTFKYNECNELKLLINGLKEK